MTPEKDKHIADLVIRAWSQGEDTTSIGRLIQLRAELLNEPVPDIGPAQAHAHNVIALYLDTKHALRQQEERRA